MSEAGQMGSSWMGRRDPRRVRDRRCALAVTDFRDRLIQRAPIERAKVRHSGVWRPALAQNFRIVLAPRFV
jgi:hypothetical protein